MSEQVPSALVIVDQRSFEVTTYQQSPQSILLTVVADGRDQWRFDIAGWRTWSCGASWGEFYIWAARQLIVFPKGSLGPVELSVDEDLLFVFKVDLGWLLVCETSIRLFGGGQREFARVEFGDVIETARWADNRLLVLDQAGSQSAITVKGGELILEVVE